MKAKDPKEFRLPRSFHEGFDHAQDIFSNVQRKEAQLEVLRKEIKFLRSKRHMDTVRLFLEQVKAHVCTFTLGLLAAIALLSMTGCATTGVGSLAVKDGGFCVCVDPSSGDLSSLEGWCYKVNSVTTGAEDTSASK